MKEFLTDGGGTAARPAEGDEGPEGGGRAAGARRPTAAPPTAEEAKALGGLRRRSERTAPAEACRQVLWALRDRRRVPVQLLTIRMPHDRAVAGLGARPTE